jgi:hypothetical protein
MKRNVMSDSLTNRENIGVSKSVVIWDVLLFIITFVGAFPLIVGNLNLENLTESSPILPLVFTGIILTAYAPSLAALLVAGFWHGKAVLRAFLSQLATWRVGVAWYFLALLGPIVLVLLANVINILLGGAPPRSSMHGYITAQMAVFSSSWSLMLGTTSLLSLSQSLNKV